MKCKTKTHTQSKAVTEMVSSKTGRDCQTERRLTK